MKKSHVLLGIGLLSCIWTIPVAAQTPACIVTIPGNTGYGENRSYYCTDRLVNSVEISSTVYGLSSSIVDRATLDEYIDLEHALEWHIDRNEILGPQLVYSSGRFICSAFGPTDIRGIYTEIYSDYMTQYQENFMWNEVNAGYADSGPCTTYRGIASGFFSYKVNYKCPSGGYMMKSYYHVADPSVPHCLKLIN